MLTLLAQAFIISILELDPLASIVVAGDFNEFTQARSVFSAFKNVVLDADVLASIPPEERYTYVFDQNCEQLDHVYVSPAVGRRAVQVEHIHVNNWAGNVDSRASDHDPTVGKVIVC